VKIKDVINEAGFLNRLGAGIRGAVAGVQASQARRAADPDAAVRNRVRQQNFKQELTQWQNNLNMVAKQGANVKDPATFHKVLQSYVEVHYPNAQVSTDINQVAPTNPKSISDYLFAAYNSEMDSTTPAVATTPDTPQVPNPQEGSVLLVKAANGEQYFKSYKGTWHVKGAVPQEFSVGGTKITNPAQTTELDKLLPQAKLVGIKPDPKDNTGQAFLYDQRKTALLAKRSGKK
jgi:hypothetical protein